MDLNTLPWWAVIAAALVAILGVGRFSRIVTYDVYPPSVALRMWWGKVTHDGPWSKLLTCYWCFTPWVMLGCIGWFFLGIFATWILVVWWLFWGWLGLSYVASMVLARDEPQ